MKEIIREVLIKIKNAGYEAYLVGGYPRDYYLGKNTDDYDITTNAKPEELKMIFPHADDSDSKYGKIILKEENSMFEITTYRKEENYQNYRFPKDISYVDSLYEDLMRRDFIMNTLCMDENGNFIDLLKAKDDIDKKVITVVGETDKKIEEDAIRILRAIRFASSFNFTLSEELEKAIKKYKKNIKELSYFRKKEELNKIFLSDYAEYGISLLKKFELEEELEIERLDKLNIHTSLLGIWAQLKFSSKYEFPSKEKKSIEIIKTILGKEVLDPFLLYQYGHYYISIAAEIKGISKNSVLELYQDLPIHHRSEIALTSKELEKMVSKDMISKVYEDLEEQILLGNLENLKIFLKKYIEGKYNRRKE